MSNKSKPLTGLLQWERVEVLIEKIRSLGPWYIHSPHQGMESLFVTDGSEAAAFLSQRSEEIKTRQRGAGWIYVHTPESPSWIKIYDPLKCGSSCSITTPPAWWEMTLDDPREDIPPAPQIPEKKSLGNWFKTFKAGTKKV